MGVVAVAAVVVGLGVRTLIPEPEETQRGGAVNAAPGTTTTPPASEEPGPATVQFSPDAREHPEAPAIQQLLTAYFEAINNKSYEKWRGLVTAEVGQAFTSEQWHAAYSSTKDGSILVRRVINASGGTLRVMLTFTSTQDVDKSPQDNPSTCSRWQAIYTLGWEGRSVRVGKGSPLNTFNKPCGQS